MRRAGAFGAVTIMLATAAAATAAPPPRSARAMHHAAPAAAPASATAAPPATAPAGPEAKPIGDPSAWFGGDPYPPQARAAGMHGRTAFRIDTDRLGRVTGCNIVQSSGYPILDSTTCNILVVNGRFSPAHDASGTAVPGAWTSAMVWQLSASPVETDAPDIDRDFGLHDIPKGGEGGAVDSTPDDASEGQGGGHHRGGHRGGSPQ